jgi:hypothetical protein
VNEDRPPRPNWEHAEPVHTVPVHSVPVHSVPVHTRLSFAVAPLPIYIYLHADTGAQNIGEYPGAEGGEGFL